MLLDSVFNDPTLRKTNFVMVHAGAGGFNGIVPYLLMKPNVYADISEQPWMTSVNHMVPGCASCWSGIPKKCCSEPIFILDSASQLGRSRLSDYA